MTHAHQSNQSKNDPDEGLTSLDNTIRSSVGYTDADSSVQLRCKYRQLDDSCRRLIKI